MSAPPPDTSPRLSPLSPEIAQLTAVHQLFERQTQLTPQGLAIEAGKARLSYDQLNRRANQLGRYLQSRGVGPGLRVAICLERSNVMAVAALAVLKTGAA